MVTQIPSDNVGAPTNPTAPAAGRSGGRIKWSQLAFPMALVAMTVFGLIAYPTFRSLDGLLNVLSFSSILMIVALGQTLVVLGRGADLSVGSMAGLSGAVFAVLLAGGWPMWASLLGALLLSLAIGVIVHGLLITKLRISFLIVTLGTFSLLRSQVQVVLNGQSVTVDAPMLDSLANGRWLGIPALVWIAAALYVLVVLLLRCTGYGRALYATGSNPTAARLAGLPVDRVIIISFALCALLAGLAGLLLVGQLGSAQPTAGAGLEMSSLAAVLLGGTRFSGGNGNATRTLLGVLFLGILNNILFIAGVSSFWQGTASGAVLIAAVAIDRSRKE
ncbi:ABC transporter permease [Nakamurella lactea]|uniref:ABC transporter permease n=1 Tax=Nakamurella lactea TaxID=459515 RepID=UPI0003F8191D|nr:ABC transporter permease [Nakamurella lactea]